MGFDEGRLYNVLRVVRPPGHALGMPVQEILVPAHQLAESRVRAIERSPDQLGIRQVSEVRIPRHVHTRMTTGIRPESHLFFGPGNESADH